LRSTKAQKVQRFFTERAAEFEAIYSPGKSFLSRFLDWYFRRSIPERFRLTFERCQPVEGRSVLDIGCGPGHYLVEFAKRGAGRALGIDFSEEMLDLARENAGRIGVLDRLELVCGDFLTHTFGDKFDYSLAIGLFDYVPDPVPYMSKTKDLTTELMVMSFPKKWLLRTVIRKIRLSLKGCPVYFYSKGRIIRLLRQAGINDYEILSVYRDYLVLAHPP
jgi:SAM-dependent methyltransferase